MFVGGHVSIAGGFEKCIDRAQALGADCLMTFASSPRSLQTRQFPPEEIEKYLAKKAAARMGPHFFHGVYLVNLATSDPDYLQVSINSLVSYQKIAGVIGAVGTIFHIGSHQGRGGESVYPQIITSINSIVLSAPAGVKLFLENAAGLSGTVGDSFEELNRIIKALDQPERVGVCIDTQHSFASGYPVLEILNKFEEVIGLEYLSVLHLNDSLVDFSSHRDRHANWGEGIIGLDTLEKFLHDSRLKDIPLILEVPGDNHSGPRASDIAQIRSLLSHI